MGPRVGITSVDGSAARQPPEAPALRPHPCARPPAPGGLPNRWRSALDAKVQALVVGTLQGELFDLQLSAPEIGLQALTQSEPGPNQATPPHSTRYLGHSATIHPAAPRFSSDRSFSRSMCTQSATSSEVILSCQRPSYSDPNCDANHCVLSLVMTSRSLSDATDASSSTVALSRSESPIRVSIHATSSLFAATIGSVIHE